jgi:hypothetical protein
MSIPIRRGQLKLIKICHCFEVPGSDEVIREKSVVTYSSDISICPCDVIVVCVPIGDIS